MELYWQWYHHPLIRCAPDGTRRLHRNLLPHCELCRHVSSVSNSLSLPQATPARSYGPSEVFAVQLSAVTQSNLLFPAGVDPARAQSIIEPRGVVQILPQNYTSIEGQLVCVCCVCVCVCVYVCAHSSPFHV